MPQQFPKDHCSRWARIPQRKLTEANRLHIQLLVQSFRTGIYNLPINWKGIDWGSNTWTRFCVSKDLATCDFNHLTRLVIGAHDNAVRVQISPCNMRNVYVDMWSRRQRSASGTETHPSIEIAVIDYRKSVRA